MYNSFLNRNGANPNNLMNINSSSFDNNDEKRSNLSTIIENAKV
jgi:hypothetical protein